MCNRWEFPGGKVEEGETDSQAIIREMNEEFGITVEVLQKITTGTFFPHYGIEKKYVLTEHTEYEWVGINEIPKDNFVDSDLAVYPQIRKFLLDNFK